MTRGSGIACTQIIATPVGSPSMVWSPPAIRTSTPNTTIPRTVHRRCSCSKPTRPDHAEDVTGWADTKLAGLLEHHSQYRSTMHIEPDDDGTQLAAFRRKVLDRLAEGGAAVDVEHAELFKVITEL